jgi:hypothetical protein
LILITTKTAAGLWPVKSLQIAAGLQPDFFLNHVKKYLGGIITTSEKYGGIITTYAKLEWRNIYRGLPQYCVAWRTRISTRTTKQRRVVMESSLARLGSGSSRIFLLFLEKLEPKNQQSLIGSTEKNSGLKSLIF